MNDTDVTLQRHKDGKLAIQTAPEIFLCTRGSIQDLIDQHNQRLDEAINATTQRDQLKHDYDESREEHWRTLDAYQTHHGEAEKTTAELRRLEAELAKASRLQQTATIAGQTIQDLTKENDNLRRLNIEATQLASRYATALHKIANTDYRGNRSAEQTIAYTALTTTEP
jgi:hypothetical protein